VFKTFTKALLLAILAFAVANASMAYAFSSEPARTGESIRFSSQSDLGSVLAPLQYAQSRPKKLKPRSVVMQEVKRRYDAEVLKITLDEAREVYKVRILMPNGKVCSIRISAKR